MDDSTALLCLKLHGTPLLGDTLLTRLLLYYGSPLEVWQSNPREWSLLEASKEAIAAAVATWQANAFPIDIEAQLATLNSLGAQVLCITDEAYPALLTTIYDPPPLLYLRGDASLLQQAQLAIVGSRRASPAGLRAARELSGQLASSGLHICSGLALGIDGEAHRGALAVGGSTVGVMASGIDQIYPARHKNLAEEMVGQGCLVTEYPPGCKPARYRFPQRNRILSGLSLGVLVIEAALPSGSLITAGTALEQGREVFALPWSMYHERGRGCLRLIRDGAKMVENMADITDELGPLYALQQDLFVQPAPKAPSAASRSPGQQKILAMIGYEAVSVDELVGQSLLPVAAVMAALSALEIEGCIARSGGGYIHC